MKKNMKENEKNEEYVRHAFTSSCSVTQRLRVSIDIV